MTNVVDHEKLETHVRYALHWLHYEDELPHQEREPKKESNLKSDFVEHIYNSFPLSQTLFPSVLRVIRTGSRAEKTYLDNADTDNIFEIGPGTVFEKTWHYCHWLCTRISFNGGFYWAKTSNDGYYRIEDENGGFLYPKVLQVKVGTLLLFGKSSSSIQYRGNPRLNSSRFSKLLKRERDQSVGVKDDGETKTALRHQNEDQVLAMRLDEWPIEIWDGMESKLKWCSYLKDTLKGLPLYFVPKSHPNSDHPKVEWRLSFSMAEKAIVSALPPIHKRAFMICKSLNEKFKDIWDAEQIEPLTTFHWKTALLWIMDECDENLLKRDDHRQVYDLVKNLVKYLLQALKIRKLTNYFVPGMNLLTIYSEEDLRFSEKLLEEKLGQLPKMLLSEVEDCITKRCHNMYTKGKNFLIGSALNVDISAMNLLEGYFRFFVTLYWFKGDRNNAITLWSTLPNGQQGERAYMDYYFLSAITKYFPELPPPPENMHEDLKLLLDIECEYPFVAFLKALLYTEHRNQSMSLLQICPTLFEGKPPNCFGDTPCPDNLQMLYEAIMQIPDVQFKASVLNYLKDTGEIKVDELIQDVTRFCQENKNDVMIWCDAIVYYLRDCHARGVLDLEECFSPNLKLKISISDILTTPIDLYLKVLKECLEKRSAAWISADIENDGREKVIDFLQNQRKMSEQFEQARKEDGDNDVCKIAAS